MSVPKVQVLKVAAQMQVDVLVISGVLQGRHLPVRVRATKPCSPIMEIHTTQNGFSEAPGQYDTIFSSFSELQVVKDPSMHTNNLDLFFLFISFFLFGNRRKVVVGRGAMEWRCQRMGPDQNLLT
jgi:hypothetical protein